MAKEIKRLWQCQTCDNSAKLSYDELADVGSPICTDCDEEMELTEEETPETLGCPNCGYAHFECPNCKINTGGE